MARCHTFSDLRHERESGILSMSSLTLGLYAHWRKPGAANSLQALCEAMERVGIKTLFERNSAELLGRQGLTLEELRDQVDFFITLGGDGTLLRLVRDLRGKMRSEERRVGKECRSRWSPYH